MIKTTYCFLFISLFYFAACGVKKKKTMDGADEINAEEFFAAYPQRPLPFSYGATSFPAKENDSLLIGKVVFNRFIPDSMIAPLLSRTKEEFKFYPEGALDEQNGVVYLLTRAVSPARKVLLLTAHDKDRKLMAALPLVKLTANAKTDVHITIDKSFNISKDITQHLSNGIEISGHDVYVLNKSARAFTLIMTDSLGDGFTELVNPIDTLPQKNKYSGDYGGSKMNLISIRDGLREGRFRFFIHLEKKDKDCMGELKGEAVFVSPTVAEYRQGGDPCVIKFTFTGNKVTLEEIEGCGSRMGSLDCSFNGDYTRKKEPKPATAKNSK